MVILRYLRKLLSRRPSPQPPRTTHFSAEEWRCKDGTPLPPKCYEAAQELMNQLEVVREHFDAPVRIISGYRSRRYNRRKGARDTSRHRTGEAADIRVDGVDARDVADAIAQLIASGRMKQGGLGSYPKFTHYDVRGYRARWRQ